MKDKKYAAFIIATNRAEESVLKTRTYLIPLTPDVTGDDIYISNQVSTLEKTFTISVENLCELILDFMPKAKVSKIVVDTLGSGIAIYRGISQIVQRNGLDIPVEAIGTIRHVLAPHRVTSSSIRFKCIHCGERKLVETSHDGELHCSHAVCGECGAKLVLWYDDLELQVVLAEDDNLE